VLLHNSAGELVTSVNQTKPGDVVRVQLTDGVLDTRITTVTPGP
jgi:exonuclease VII large subunit